MDDTRFRALVAELEIQARQHPVRYKRRVRWLIALGYGYVLGLLVLLLGATLFVAYLMATRRGTLLGVKLLIPLVLLSYLILKSLWLRSSAPEGVRLDPKALPVLARRVEEIRRALKAPRIDEIILLRDYNASVTQIPRFGVLGVPRTYLMVGLPLMYGLGPRQFDAVLAHELAHLSGAHPKYSIWLGGISATWQRLLGELRESNGITDFLFERFARWYIPRVDAHSFALRRSDEFEADRDSASATSRRAAAQALMSIELRAPRFDAYWTRLRARLETEPAPPAVTWTEIPAWLAAADAAEHRAAREADLAASLKRERLVEDSHPSLRERLTALGALPDPVVPGELLDALVPALGTTAATHYLGDAATGHLRAFEQDFVPRNAESWAAAHEAMRKDRATVGAFAARDAAGESLSGEELWSWANLATALDGDEQAAPLVERAVAADPDNVDARFVLGRILLARGDAAGVGHLDRAMELEPQATPGAIDLIRRFHAQLGDPEALAAAEARTDAQFQRLREYVRERAGITPKDTFAAGDFTAADLAAIAAAARVRGVRDIWVAEKVPAHRGRKRVVAVYVRTKGTLMAWSEARRNAALGEVERVLKLGDDPEVLVMIGNEGLDWYIARVKREGGILATAKRGAVRARPDRWHQRHRRALVFAGVGAGVVALFVWATWVPTRMYDESGALAPGDNERFDMQLMAIMSESGVDVRVILDTLKPGDAIDDVTLRAARRLGMGRTSDRRGLLLFIDTRTGAMRIEVGPRLEGIFTDGFVGRVLRAHTAPVRADMPMKETVLSTLMMLHHRIRESVLALEYDPRTETAIADSVRLAAGAGASFSGFAGAAERLLVVKDTAMERALGPGQTPGEAYERYLLWLSLPVHLPRAHFLTPRSRTFFSQEITITPAFRDYLRYLHLGTEVRVITEEDLAVVVATRNPLIEPLFFRRTKEGWMMDVDAERLHAQSLVGTPYTWRWNSHGDEWDRRFERHLVGQSFLRRFAGGANEMLNWRGKGS